MRDTTPEHLRLRYRRREVDRLCRPPTPDPELSCLVCHSTDVRPWHDDLGTLFVTCNTCQRDTCPGDA